MCQQDMCMKILKTYQHEKFNYIETTYKGGYPTLLLKQSEFFNSINRCVFTPVPIGYTYTRTNGKT